MGQVYFEPQSNIKITMEDLEQDLDQGNDKLHNIFKKVNNFDKERSQTIAASKTQREPPK